MSMLAKKFKREHFPVAGSDELFVRPMKDSESKRQKLLSDDELKVWFAFGICLTDFNGTPLFTKTGQTDEQFANDVRVALDQLDFDFLAMSKVCEAIATVSKYNPENMRKN